MGVDIVNIVSEGPRDSDVIEHLEDIELSHWYSSLLICFKIVEILRIDPISVCPQNSVEKKKTATNPKRNLRRGSAHRPQELELVLPNSWACLP